MPRRFLPARLDRKVCVTRPVLLKPDQGRLTVVTRWGLVLVVRERGWTWYRWVLAGWWTGVVVEKGRTEAQAVREAARLIRVAREQARMQPPAGPPWRQ